MLTRPFRISVGIVCASFAGVLAIAACDLNPQPLPPGDTASANADGGATAALPGSDDAGSSSPIVTTNGDGGGLSPGLDGGVADDSGAVNAGGSDAATGDAAGGEPDAGGSDDGGSGGRDGGEAVDAGGDAAEAGGDAGEIEERDASADATGDAT